MINKRAQIQGYPNQDTPNFQVTPPIKKKSKWKLIFLGTFVIILIVILIFIFNSEVYFEVWALTQSRDLTGNYAVDCSETDKGLDYFKQGGTYYRGSSDHLAYTDSCATIFGVVNEGQPNEYTLTEGDLQEHSCYGLNGEEQCSESSCKFTKYHCPNGCLDGACVP